MEEVARLDDVYRGGFIGEEEYLRRRLLLLHVSRDDAGGANPPAAGGNHPTIVWCDSPPAHPQPPADHTPGMPPRNRHDHDGHGPEWAITTTTSAERGLRGDWATTTLVMVDEEGERALYDAGLEAKEWGHQRQTLERGRREAAVLTPSWRLLDEESEDDEETWEGDDGNDEDDEEEEEDTDDEAYERRHKPYERGEVAAGLLEMTMAELRELLRQRSLPQSGVKTDLALRLAQFFVP
ncbi:SAP domain containing protein [Acanthamoeba castellanii str. Neff]|uniref:SAP domain containing protein n=1 Tax=Acanthamoeba castellanii (strain ATCC 30010 / Neff) TaxID=1257118 RepID=L8HCQ7_ACACF|nr:SAP domain containing protein [Acanthamoeba castellanii str. Neff]ELR23017.1 SAP domain containing protein [Acanthamoeba castellanii str. Neff]